MMSFHLELTNKPSRMKKYFVLFASIAMASVSCQKEITVQEPVNEQGISFSVNAETMPLTKVSFDDNGVSNSKAVWNAGETATLVNISDSKISRTSQKIVQQDIVDGAAKFSFSLVPEGRYRIFSKKPISMSTDNGTAVFHVVPNQIQYHPGNSSSRAYLVGGTWDGNQSKKFGDITVSEGTNSCDAYFKLVGSLLRFNIYDSSKVLAGKGIQSVTVTAEDGTLLNGKMTVDYTTGEFKTIADGSSSISVIVQSNEIVGESIGTSKGIYAVTAPVNIPAKDNGTVTYTVVSDGYVYEFKSKSAKVWNNGAVNYVKIDLAYADKVTKVLENPMIESNHPAASQMEGSTFVKDEVVDGVTYRTYACGMKETSEKGVFTMEKIWLDGEQYNINFPAGNSGFYYNAFNFDVNAYVSDEDQEFDVVYSKNPMPMKIQSYGGKNYANQYYTITLDTNRMKLKVKQHRGTSFWLVGADCDWKLEGKTSFDTNPVTKTASWSGYLKAGNYKIQGENTSDDGWKGEWYYPDIVGEWKYGTNTEKGVTLNSDDPDNRHWNLPEAGYYKIDFNYSDMTIQIEKVESLDIKVNDKALKYIGNNEYSITITFTKGENFVLSGCKKLEYVMMDPDFLEKDAVTQTYKFNAVDGTYTFILHLGTHDASWTSDGQTPTNSWTLFKGINNGGTYSTMIIAGDGVANLTIKNCVGWTCESQNQPFMAEVDDNVYQFTGRYRENWSKLEPYDRWSNKLDFKYFGNTTWGNGIQNGVTLDDKTGNIQQNPEGSKDSNGKSNEGNLTWKSPDKRWDDGDTYRMTVDMTKNSQTVTFEKITLK